MSPSFQTRPKNHTVVELVETSSRAEWRFAWESLLMLLCNWSQPAGTVEQWRRTRAASESSDVITSCDVRHTMCAHACSLHVCLHNSRSFLMNVRIFIGKNKQTKPLVNTDSQQRINNPVEVGVVRYATHRLWNTWNIWNINVQYWSCLYRLFFCILPPPRTIFIYLFIYLLI